MENVNLTQEMKIMEDYLSKRIVERNKGVMYRPYECCFTKKRDAIQALKELNKLSANIWEMRTAVILYYWLQIKDSSA